MIDVLVLLTLGNKICSRKLSNRNQRSIYLQFNVFFFVEIETRSCETVLMSKFIKFQKSKKIFDIYRIYLMKNIFSLHLKYSKEI